MLCLFNYIFTDEEIESQRRHGTNPGPQGKLEIKRGLRTHVFLTPIPGVCCLGPLPQHISRGCSGGVGPGSLVSSESSAGQDLLPCSLTGLVAEINSSRVIGPKASIFSLAVGQRPPLVSCQVANRQEHEKSQRERISSPAPQKDRSHSLL